MRLICACLLIAVCLMPTVVLAAEQFAAESEVALELVNQSRAWKWWTIGVCGSAVIALMVAWSFDKARQEKEPKKHRVSRRRRT